MEIQQERGKGKTLNAVLVKERELRIEDATHRKAISYKIDIVALKDDSQRKIQLGWKWFIAGLAILTGAILLPLIFTDYFAEPLVRQLVYVVAILAGATCFYLAWKATVVKQIFYSRNAEVPVVELFSNKPTKKEFADFVGKVETCILDIQQKLDLSLKNQLAGEMKMLRRLSEQGVLSSSEYEKAKAVLFSLQ